MQVRIVAVGKLKNSPEQDICDRYLKRMHPTPIIKEVEEKRNFPTNILKKREGSLILESCSTGTILIALDEGGGQETSLGFAETMRSAIEEGRDLTYIIGGADGLSGEVLQNVSRKLSFGRMTWPHALVRAMLLEQLYRAQQILAGHPYHRG